MWQWGMWVGCGGVQGDAHDTAVRRPRGYPVPQGSICVCRGGALYSGALHKSSEPTHNSSAARQSSGASASQQASPHQQDHKRSVKLTTWRRHFRLGRRRVSKAERTPSNFTATSRVGPNVPACRRLYNGVDHGCQTTNKPAVLAAPSGQYPIAAKTI